MIFSQKIYSSSCLSHFSLHWIENVFFRWDVPIFFVNLAMKSMRINWGFFHSSKFCFHHNVLSETYGLVYGSKKISITQIEMKILLCFTENDSNLVIANYIMKKYEFDWKKVVKCQKQLSQTFIDE